MLVYFSLFKIYLNNLKQSNECLKYDKTENYIECYFFSYYNLMKECWKTKSKQRPTFRDITADIGKTFNSTPSDDFYYYSRQWNAISKLMTWRPSYIFIQDIRKRWTCSNSDYINIVFLFSFFYHLVTLKKKYLYIRTYVASLQICDFIIYLKQKKFINAPSHIVR